MEGRPKRRLECHHRLDPTGPSRPGRRPPPGSDIVSLAATETRTGTYVVTVGSTDAYTVAAVDLTGSKNHQQPSLSITGSLTTGTLAYLTPTAGKTSAVTVNAGGIFDITNLISDTNSIAETITVAGTGAGGHVKLGGLAVSDTTRSPCRRFSTGLSPVAVRMRVPAA